MEWIPGPELIFKYFPHLTTEQKEQYQALGELYSYWNKRINVVSRKDMEGFYLKHLLHSLGIAKVRKFKEGERVLDVGTGGGFPGIPLAILFPDTQFHLIDSIGKKIKVVQRVIEQLDLKNASAEQIRAEEVHGHYNFVVCRAVTRLNKLIHWTGSTLKPGGQLLCLKGGDLGHEINEVGAGVAIYDLSGYFDEDFFETKKVLVVRGAGRGERGAGSRAQS